MAAGLPSQVIAPSAVTSPAWVQHLAVWAGDAWSYHPVEVGSAALWIEAGIGLWLLAAPRGTSSRLAGLASLTWGLVVWVFGESFGQVFAAGPELAVRRSGRGPALRGGRRAARAAGPGLADAAAGPGPAGRAGRVPDRHGGPAGLAGARVLAGYLGRAARHPGRPGPDAGRDTAAAGPVGAAVRLRLGRPRARVRGEPGRGDRARGRRGRVPRGPAPGDRPGRGRLRRAVPAGLGADRGPGLPRRPGRRPGQHDPDGPAGSRRLPRPHPRASGRAAPAAGARASRRGISTSSRRTPEAAGGSGSGPPPCAGR